MKQNFAKTAFFGVILSSLMCLPAISLAIDLFDTSTGYLVIPEVDINGDTFYDDVTLKLDFSTGAFEVVSFSPKPETISTTPLSTMEEQDIKMDFMGCTRSGRNKIACHLKLTSLGGFDRTIVIYADEYWGISHLYDDLGNTYEASEVTVGSLNSTSYVTQNLIAGIPTLAKFEFKNILPNASSLSLFEPTFQTNGRNIGTHFTGDFRDINF